MTDPDRSQEIGVRPFGKLPDGSEAKLYTLTNKQGAKATMTDYGCIVVSLEAPDRQGVLADVALGYESLEDYLRSKYHMGGLVGRVANRIGGAAFTLDGKVYALAQTAPGSCLHGGQKGFDRVLWKAEPMVTPQGPALMLRYLSPDGDEGFPGNLNVEALHTWTHENELRIELSATTDRPTVVNLSHHSYFNLAGAGRGDILGHQAQIFSDAFTPMGGNLVVSGEILPVKGTPFDFNAPHAIGERIEEKDEQLIAGRGYDHNWVLRKNGPELAPAARVTEPLSGRRVELLATQPGMQFYTGNFLNPAAVPGKKGLGYGHRSGFCLEPQHFPDSPNKPKFPSTRLDPGQTYHHSLVYRFLVQ